MKSSLNCWKKTDKSKKKKLKEKGWEAIEQYVGNWKKICILTRSMINKYKKWTINNFGERPNKSIKFVLEFTLEIIIYI